MVGDGILSGRGGRGSMMCFVFVPRMMMRRKRRRRRRMVKVGEAVVSYVDAEE